METGLREGEEVLWGEWREGADEEEEGGDEENCEGSCDRGWECADRDMVDGGLGADFFIVTYCLWEEDGAKEEGEGLDSVGYLVCIYWGFKMVKLTFPTRLPSLRRKKGYSKRGNV